MRLHLPCHRSTLVVWDSMAHESGIRRGCSSGGAPAQSLTQRRRWPRQMEAIAVAPGRSARRQSIKTGRTSERVQGGNHDPPQGRDHPT